MPKLLDCPSCGALMPPDRRCCPHCHCKSSSWKKSLLVAAALGLGSPACGGDGTNPKMDDMTIPDSPADAAYGGPITIDLSRVDSAEPGDGGD
jgi:hypothetical protein